MNSLAHVFREICTTVVEDDGVAFDATTVTGEPVRAEVRHVSVRDSPTAPQLPNLDITYSISLSKVDELQLPRKVASALSDFSQKALPEPSVPFSYPFSSTNPSRLLGQLSWSWDGRSIVVEGLGTFSWLGVFLAFFEPWRFLVF